MTRQHVTVVDDAAHRLVSALLPAYADDALGAELPDEIRAAVEAHLAACARCAEALRLAHAVRARLQRLRHEHPAAAAPPALRARIRSTIDGTPTPARPPARAAIAPQRSVARLAAWGGWLVAAALAVVLVGARAGTSRAPAPWHVATARTGPDAPVLPPMVQGAVADYEAHVAAELPGDAQSLAAVAARVPFAVEALPAASARVVGAWTTTIRGEPVAAVAYRWHDRVIVQYVVSEALFFRHPAVRAAVTAQGLYATRDGALGVVARPNAASGSVVVGNATPEELAGLFHAARS